MNFTAGPTLSWRVHAVCFQPRVFGALQVVESGGESCLGPPVPGVSLRSGRCSWFSFVTQYGCQQRG